MTIEIEKNVSDVIMYRGIVRDHDGHEISRTRPFYNRRNAVAATIALRIDLQERVS
jgi:hypothetical protein